jgi:hypothetical protein
LCGFRIKEIGEINMNDNETAFPFTSRHADNMPDNPGSPGMFMLDYFASKAMQSIIVNLKEGIHAEDVIIMCKDSYFIAREMLYERERVLNEQKSPQ